MARGCRASSPRRWRRACAACSWTLPPRHAVFGRTDPLWPLFTVAAGIAAALAAARAIHIPFVVPPLATPIAFAVSVLVGVVFGVVPARKASRLHPLAALRFE